MHATTQRIYLDHDRLRCALVLLPEVLHSEIADVHVRNLELAGVLPTMMIEKSQTRETRTNNTSD